MDKLKQYAKQFMTKFNDTNATLLGAAQAYYYLLSIFPLFAVCFAIIPYLNIDPDDIIGFLNDVLPSEMVSIVEDNVLAFVDSPNGGLITVGILGVIWSASNAMNTLIQSINEAYHVQEERGFIQVRLLAILLTLGMIITLIFAMILPIFGSQVLQFIESYTGFESLFASVISSLRWVIGFALLIVFLMILYRFAPSMKLPFKYVFPGAIVAGVLWLIISFGFAFYVSNFGNYSAVYGSLGGIIILMMWFYLTGTILMVGAIINALYREKKQTPVEIEEEKSKSS